MTDPSAFELAKDLALPVITGIAAWFAGRLSMSKKDRKDFEQKNFENSTKLIEDHDTAYADYTAAIDTYVKAQSPTAESFLAIATKGDRYFYRVQLISAAILSDKVDSSIRDTVLMPKIRPVVARTLPDHYGTLNEIAKKQGFAYAGELRRSDYEAIYAVVERFGSASHWESEN